LRDRTVAQFGAPGGVGENEWVNHYVNMRRDWLATNPNPALHPTVYRMDSFLNLIQDSRYDLTLPFVLRGITIDCQCTPTSPGGNWSESRRRWRVRPGHLHRGAAISKTAGPQRRRHRGRHYSSI